MTAMKISLQTPKMYGSILVVDVTVIAEIQIIVMIFNTVVGKPSLYRDTSSCTTWSSITKNTEHDKPAVLAFT